MNQWQQEVYGNDPAFKLGGAVRATEIRIMSARSAGAGHDTRHNVIARCGCAGNYCKNSVRHTIMRRGIKHHTFSHILSLGLTHTGKSNRFIVRVHVDPEVRRCDSIAINCAHCCHIQACLIQDLLPPLSPPSPTS
jgi:hypothetical protein